MADHARNAEPNRLIHETSPYLLQHAYNPVDWHPWGPEALSRAAAEDKPILLSVGYSACHWCHVMAHESFEDPEIAALMNELFINIKVDREERPDIDAIYMEAVQALTGGGGWPMTVFLTPDGKPFYGGTYFPPVSRYNMPGFPQLLMAISEAWQNRRKELLSAGDRLAEALNRTADLQSSGAPLDRALLDRAVERMLRAFDKVEGGFGAAPKFPQPMNLDFLLGRYVQGLLRHPERRAEGPQSKDAAMTDGAERPSTPLQGDRKGRPYAQDAPLFDPTSLSSAPSMPPGSVQGAPLLDAATFTLTKMARGGMYDQLGGGFHRYSTDSEWLTPHFEKMLYDNAQLARAYLHAWQVTGDPLFRRIVEETLDYVLREMTSPEGGFYSAQDADSEGKEGKFFVWTPAEINDLLGPEDGRLFCEYFGVTPRGNFHEAGGAASILHARRELDVVAADLGVTPERLREAVERGRKILFEDRERRVHPGRDDKVLAEWNGLMLHAFAEAGVVLGREDYVSAARRNANFLLSAMRAEGDDDHLRLYRTWKDGRAHLNAYLEDYAAVALGMLALYEVTFELRWLRAGLDLARTILDRFHDGAGGGFFQTAADHEKLVARRKDFVDSAIPAGNSLAADLLQRLARLLDRPELAQHVAGVLALMAEALGEQPLAFGRLLGVLDFYVNPGFEIAIVGDPAGDDTAALLAEVRRRFMPNTVLAAGLPGGEAATEIPLLAGREMRDGRATAYVCRNYACNLPVTEPAALARQLEG